MGVSEVLLCINVTDRGTDGLSTLCRPSRGKNWRNTTKSKHWKAGCTFVNES